MAALSDHCLPMTPYVCVVVTPPPLPPPPPLITTTTTTATTTTYLVPAHLVSQYPKCCKTYYKVPVSCPQQE